MQSIGTPGKFARAAKIASHWSAEDSRRVADSRRDMLGQWHAARRKGPCCRLGVLIAKYRFCPTSHSFIASRPILRPSSRALGSFQDCVRKYNPACASSHGPSQCRGVIARRCRPALMQAVRSSLESSSLCARGNKYRSAKRSGNSDSGGKRPVGGFACLDEIHRNRIFRFVVKRLLCVLPTSEQQSPACGS